MPNTAPTEPGSAREYQPRTSPAAVTQKPASGLTPRLAWRQRPGGGGGGGDTAGFPRERRGRGLRGRPRSPGRRPPGTGTDRASKAGRGPQP